MKKGHIYGTTIPMISPGTMPNDFALSEKNFQLMKDSGIQMVRMFFCFPFADSSMTETNEDYRKYMAGVHAYQEHGIECMGTMPTPEQSMVDSEGKVSLVRHYPLWMGGYDDDAYYDNLEKACEFVANDTRDSITYWQIANEMDNISFHAPLTFEQNVRWLKTAAKGIKKGNPDAKCCTNLAGISGGNTLNEPELARVHPYAEKLLEALYCGNEELFDFAGLDGYFGCWMAGGPEDWVKYIDDTHRITGKPVMISEWGYSTLQKGTPRPADDQKRYFNQDVCRMKSWDAPGYAKWRNLDHSEELQAEYITKCLEIFRDHPQVMGNLFFQWQDQQFCWQCGEPDCPAECAWGCIRNDGTPKKGYYALANFIKSNR